MIIKYKTIYLFQRPSSKLMKSISRQFPNQIEMHQIQGNVLTLGEVVNGGSLKNFPFPQGELSRPGPVDECCPSGGELQGLSGLPVALVSCDVTWMRYLTGAISGACTRRGELERGWEKKKRKKKKDR